MSRTGLTIFNEYDLAFLDDLRAHTKGQRPGDRGHANPKGGVVSQLKGGEGLVQVNGGVMKPVTPSLERLSSNLPLARRKKATRQGLTWD